MPSPGAPALDPATREATADGQTLVQLSNAEFAQLQALMVRHGATLPRDELEDRAYGCDEDVDSKAPECLIHGLRKKLGGTSIKNVRGVGWRV